MNINKMVCHLLIIQAVTWISAACSTTASTSELETEDKIQTSGDSHVEANLLQPKVSESVTENTTTTTKITGNAQRAATIINAFTTDLYQVLKSEQSNLFFSPYSISSALVMIYAGTRENTAQQLATALHLQQVNHSDFSSLKQSLINTNTEDAYQLSIANAIWMQKNFLANPEFIYLLQDSYRAKLQLIDFEADVESARNKINGWTQEKTQQKIQDLLQPGIITEKTRLILTNAIYFKGNWLNAFNEEKTAPMSFKTTTNEQVEVATMFREDQFNYAEDQEVQLIELPYKTQGEQSGLSMVILLPKQIDKLTEVEQHIDRWLSPNFKKEKVKLYLPKFNLTSEFDLKKVLETLGVVDAFDADQANLTGINDKEKLFISAVVHKAFIDVNEKGTEASASTAIVTATRSIAKVNEFRADHPFLFWIRDQQSGALLFMGRVINPLQ